MYHSRFKGSHYENGLKYGSLLLKNGAILLDNVPFEISNERIQFAKDCLPYYEKYFPEIVEEIKGLCDGQKCSFEKIIGILFSMYCIMPEEHCSCLAVRNEHGVFFGRNSDFLTAIEKYNTNSIYQLQGSGYSFIGNTTAFIEMEDGVNEHGLAIGLTSIYPTAMKPGLNAGMILRFILEKAKTVKEALALLNTLPIASSQTFVLADANEDIALVEANADKINVIQPSEPEAYVCSTNKFHTPLMMSYNNVTHDDWQAQERYETMVQSLGNNLSNITLEDVKDILAGKHGFLCQYDRKTGKDTVWSILYDIRAKKIYRVEGNPGRKKFREDERFVILK